MDHTQGVNGTYLSRDGRLLAAQAFGHNLMSIKIGPGGRIDVKSLTSPLKVFLTFSRMMLLSLQLQVGFITLIRTSKVRLAVLSTS